MVTMRKIVFMSRIPPERGRRRKDWKVEAPFALKKPRGRGAREGADEGKPRAPPEPRGQCDCFAEVIGLWAEKEERNELLTASTAQSNDLSEGGTVASALRRDSVFHNLRRESRRGGFGASPARSGVRVRHFSDAGDERSRGG